MPILIPGIGAQGGDLEKTVSAGKDSRGLGMIINSSRGIIFASNGRDFAEAARRETEKLNDSIKRCLSMEVLQP
jgi:orotidine-5'-phosphate decarboxylase